ncbi:MAG TPA: FG-GAP-like repeat-containing protein [Vicinamibacterales bacterium]|jgi:Tfp pilus assembly protein PilF|nr:FG-GAP-like repeat-containing protein [Vicinamibacterales bacterium]
MLHPPRLLTGLVFVALTAASACSSCRREPTPQREASRDVAIAFYTGVSAMQTSQEVLAREQLERVIALEPNEPAGWANVGLLLLRQQDLDEAVKRLDRAAELAPDNGEIQRLQALAASRQGNLAKAIAHWGRALEIEPDDREAAYALALETERQGGAEHDVEAQRILEQLVTRSGNLAVRVEFARLAARRGDFAALKNAIAPLSVASKTWSPAAQAQLSELSKLTGENARAAATRVIFLKNVLLREPAYRAALAEITTPRAEVGSPLMRFVVLRNPEPQPAASDQALVFAIAPIPGATAKAALLGPLWLTGEGNPVLFAAGARGVQLLGAPTSRAMAADVTAAAPFDVNYDYRTDVAVVGSAGIRLFRQSDGGQFADATAATKLPASTLRAPYRGVWPADVDTDGDLDLVLAPEDGRPLVLRNNGDGTFLPREPFPGAARARGFAWADLDGEGVPDAAFVDDSGRVHVFLNLRGGVFQQESVGEGYGQAAALAAAELSGDSLFDLLVLARDGKLTRLTRRSTDGAWAAADVASAVGGLGTLDPATSRVFMADLDNNGAADIVVSSPTASRVLLGGSGLSFTPLRGPLVFSAQAAVDLEGDGRLELVGVLPDGQPARATAKGGKSYRWQQLRTRSATATGDQRINSFGIGGEVEVRTGLHVQKQVIGTPVVHFGLGEATLAEVVRITWPNGVLQSEFQTASGGTVTATQRLKGSCPWLFTWNGRDMGFVTDLIWRSPLGLRINAQATADVLMTEDWVKIRGDQLAPRGGEYDLRITTELWETQFFDLTSLFVVDHPSGTEVFVDERFAVPPPAFRLIVTEPIRSFMAVRDDGGRDVAAIVGERDSRHLDFAGRGPYQGITRPHFVELELPEEAPRSGPLWLVGQGWVHPTDSSINVAIAQGAHAAPEGLSLHVADASGRFRQARSGLGFPAGKDKTVMVDLTGLFASKGPRRIRLATNLEVFWDRLGWAVGRPEVRVEPRPVELMTADLSFRGYSVAEQPDPSHPERPRYELEGTAARWRDLEGYYTRFGDVRELLTTVDDRYVIMNAGDEIRLRFKEAPPPASGLVRDFLLRGDGWVKDGDFNTGFSRTMLPLPTHRSAKYDRPPGHLEDDPVYRRNASDFEKYHTRYVSAEPVRDALGTSTVSKR